MFPAEIYRAPRGRGEQSFGNLIHWNEVDKGGHVAAWEQPQLFAEEVRAAFRSLRRSRLPPSGVRLFTLGLKGDRHDRVHHYPDLIHIHQVPTSAP